MTSWFRLDTCDCKIHYKGQLNNPNDFDFTETKCNLHKNLNGKALCVAVNNLNSSFNLKQGRINLELPENKSKKAKILADKKAEKMRIRNLPE